MKTRSELEENQMKRYQWGERPDTTHEGVGGAIGRCVRVWGGAIGRCVRVWGVLSGGV